MSEASQGPAYGVTAAYYDFVDCCSIRFRHSSPGLHPATANPLIMKFSSVEIKQGGQICVSKHVADEIHIFLT